METVKTGTVVDFNDNFWGKGFVLVVEVTDIHVMGITGDGHYITIKKESVQ